MQDVAQHEQCKTRLLGTPLLPFFADDCNPRAGTKALVRARNGAATEVNSVQGGTEEFALDALRLTMSRLSLGRCGRGCWCSPFRSRSPPDSASATATRASTSRGSRPRPGWSCPDRKSAAEGKR